MSEAIESGAGESGDPAAISLALAGASRAKADAFLDEQRHHLREQMKQLQLGLWEMRMGVFLRVATALVGCAVAGSLAFMVWQAAHSRGLVVEPFSVPSDVAARGITGQVVAGQMIDKLTEMTTHESSRAAQSYANNWGNDVKVEIPETGVSIEELQYFLKNWLGHDIHISGEVYHSGQSIAVTVRGSGGDPGVTVVGQEPDLSDLLQKAAEHVYEVTQPYRYANYLDRNYDPNGLSDRIARATAIYNRLIAGDDPVERAWALNGLGTIAFNFRYDQRLSEDYYRRAMAATPHFTIAYYALAARNQVLDQEEDQLANEREACRLMANDPDINPHYATYTRLTCQAQADELLGDYTASMPLWTTASQLPDDFSVLSRAANMNGGTQDMTAQHNLAGIAAWRNALDPKLRLNVGMRARMAVEAGDWQQVMALEKEQKAAIAQAQNADQIRGRTGGYDGLRPEFALALAKLGDFVGAEAMIAPTAADDDLALRRRGMLAQLENQPARADWWFARAEAHEPSVPFADEMWGRALLLRGDADGAIAKFKLSNEKGPHFADPLEGWGEALMAKKDLRGAAAKFEEAEQYAPNWGRLHLKWGEALAAAGNQDAAQKQFVLAARLDLNATDKAELERMKASDG